LFWLDKSRRFLARIRGYSDKKRAGLCEPTRVRSRLSRTFFLLGKAFSFLANRAMRFADDFSNGERMDVFFQNHRVFFIGGRALFFGGIAGLLLNDSGFSVPVNIWMYWVFALLLMLGEFRQRIFKATKSAGSNISQTKILTL
jgi:hypothetical protein